VAALIESRHGRACPGHPRLATVPREKHAKFRRDLLHKDVDGRDKCLDRGHHRQVFGDMTDTFSARQVDGGDLVGGEEDSVLAVA
jgi:hypothetical protein